MPAYAVDLLADALEGGIERARVLILGVTYRGDVKETAFSGAFAVAQELRDRGAHVVASDPLYAPAELAGLGFEPWTRTDVDAAILQADHASYAQLTPGDLPGVRVLVDGRGIVDAARWRAAGVVVRRIGAP